MTIKELTTGEEKLGMHVIADKDLTDPANALTTKEYIVATGAVGEWQGQDGNIAYYDQIWRFITPRNGYLVMVDDEDTLYGYVDTSWTSFANLSAANQSLNATLIGTCPTVTGLSCAIVRTGNVAQITFTLTAVQVPHTDAAGSGSSGSLKIFDFVRGAVNCTASRRNLVWTGDALIDTDAGDMAFVSGLGSVAANAGDGALTGTEVDIGAISSALTLSSHVATEATLKGAGTIADGTVTATDLFLNESGTAATSDANGFLSVTGTIEVQVALIGL